MIDRFVADLDSFIAEHRRCGELDTDMTKTEPVLSENSSHAHAA
jgi:hypothetical protein